MKTEYRLAEALKDMMSEVSLDFISVSELSKKCGIDRKTFYYHFHDIYDLLTLVFLNEKIQKIESVSSLEEMLEDIFAYYKKNRAFVEASINSAGKELVQEFLFNNCYQCILRFVNRLDNSKFITVNEKKNIARFYAFGYSHSILYYLSTHKNPSIEGLKEAFTMHDNKELVDAIDKIISRRKDK